VTESKLRPAGARSNGQLVPASKRALISRQAKCPTLRGMSWVSHGRWREATSNAITRIPTVIPTRIPTVKPSRKPSTVHGVYSRESVMPGTTRVVGGRGRHLADPHGSSLRKVGSPTRPAAPNQSLHRSVADANGPGRSEMGARPARSPKTRAGPMEGAGGSGGSIARLFTWRADGC
jgi:hypothetical protein